MNTYYSSKWIDSFPESWAYALGEMLDEAVRSGQKYLSPYQFAAERRISLESALSFFMCLSDEGGVFDFEVFFECSSSYCGNKIVLDYELTQFVEEPDDPIICTECDKDYFVSTVVPYIKVYFIIKSEPESAPPTPHRRDPNSTFQALQGLPKSHDLKSKSPSSTTPKLPSDEGDVPNNDGAVTLSQLATANVSSIGEPFSIKFHHQICEFLEEWT